MSEKKDELRRCPKCNNRMQLLRDSITKVIANHYCPTCKEYYKEECFTSKEVFCLKTTCPFQKEEIQCGSWCSLFNKKDQECLLRSVFDMLLDGKKAALMRTQAEIPKEEPNSKWNSNTRSDIICPICENCFLHKSENFTLKKDQYYCPFCEDLITVEVKEKYFTNKTKPSLESTLSEICKQLGLLNSGLIVERNLDIALLNKISGFKYCPFQANSVICGDWCRLYKGKNHNEEFQCAMTIKK